MKRLLDWFADLLVAEPDDGLADLDELDRMRREQRLDEWMGDCR